MTPDYAAQYENLWRRHWWWQSRRRFVMSHIRKLHRQRPLQNILDIGCGNGLLFDDLLHLTPTPTVRGIEPDAALVTPTGPHRDRITVRLFDDTVQTPEPLDLILMLDVLEHIEHDAAATNHVAQLLNPGGHVLLTVPALMSLWSQHDEANHHFRRYDPKSLRRVLESAGLEVQSLHYYFGWTLAPMLLRRALAPAKHDPDAIYKVNVPPAPINGALYALSRAEQITLGPIGLPIGSSLIALARKR